VFGCPWRSLLFDLTVIISAVQMEAAEAIRAHEVATFEQMIRAAESHHGGLDT